MDTRNFDKEFRGILKNNEPNQIVQLTLLLGSFIACNSDQAKSFASGLNKSEARTLIVKLKELIGQHCSKNKLNNIALLEEVDPKITLKILNWLFKSNDIKNLATSLRWFLDKNPKRLTSDPTPLVARQLIQGLLKRNLKDNKVKNILNLNPREGELLLTVFKLNSDYVTLSGFSPSTDMATMFWNIYTQTNLEEKFSVVNSDFFSLRNKKPLILYPAIVSQLYSKNFDVEEAALQFNLRKSKTLKNYDSSKTLNQDVEDVLNQLTKTGIALLLMEENFLYSKTNQEKTRNKLIEKGIIEAVITLPSNIFPKIQHVPTAIVFINKSKPIDTPITFIDLRQKNLVQQDNVLFGQKLAENIFDKIENEITFQVTREEVINNGGNLRPQEYTPKFEPRNKIDLEKAIKDYKSIIANVQRTERSFMNLIRSKKNLKRSE